MIPGSLKQIDHSLSEGVWGVNRHDTIFRLNKDYTWTHISGGLKHVSVGAAGVWGVNKYDSIFYFLDGSLWQHISGDLKQIDSGPEGIVYGVNSNNDIFCRTGILLQFFSIEYDYE